MRRNNLFLRQRRGLESRVLGSCRCGLEHGGLRDKIVLVGAFWHIQLWTPEHWEAANQDEDNNYFDVMQRINEIPDPDRR